MMVKIVDTFTRLYGRAPSEKEIGAMMKLKADQEAYKNAKLRPTTDVMQTSKISKERSKISAAKRSLKERIEISKRGWAINCLLNAGVGKETIADALCITVGNVEYNMERYKLPRKNVIKPK